MRASTSLAASAAAALFLVGYAHATTFDFSYSFPTGDTVNFPTGFTSASGIFTATDLLDGSFLVTDASGQWNGEAITGLSPVNTEGNNDNLIYPSSYPVIDGFGVTFSVAGPIQGDNGLGVVNVYSGVRGYRDVAGDTGYSPVFNLSQVSSIPEPSSWALMILGVGGLGLALRRKSASVLAI